MLHAHAPTTEQHGVPRAQRGHDAISHAAALAGSAEPLAADPGSPVVHRPPAHCPPDIVQSTHAPPPAPHMLSRAPLRQLPLASQQPPHVCEAHDPTGELREALRAICIAPAVAAKAPAIA
jgi:hypothetical protein